MGVFIDRTGEKVNQLTLIEYLGNSKYKCLCECGNYVVFKSTELNEDKNRYHKINCGDPLKHKKYKNSPNNENFFGSIDTEEKAYILGFIAADGCIQPELNRIKIDLKNTNEDVLVKIQKSIGHNNSLSHYHQDTNFKSIDSTRLVISSKQMVEDLNKIGVTKHKSKTININMDLIPDDLIKHFVRGEMDGDGSIYVPKKVKGKKATITLTLSKFMADKIYNWTSIHFQINKWYKLLRNKEKEDTVTLTATNSHFIKMFLDCVYGDSSIYLDRKYNKYLEFLKFYNLKYINSND